MENELPSWRNLLNGSHWQNEEIRQLLPTITQHDISLDNPGNNWSREQDKIDRPDYVGWGLSSRIQVIDVHVPSHSVKTV